MRRTVHSVKATSVVALLIGILIEYTVIRESIDLGFYTALFLIGYVRYSIY